MPAIEARGLTKRFGGGVLAVDHLDFEALPGGVTGFLGPNGAGKTTTLRMLLGLVTPTSGTVRIDGHDYRHLPNPTMRVGAVLEASGFHPGRTARNHLRLIATVAGIPFSRVDECLDLVGLSEAAGRKVGGFSMGMRQRLELARALLGRPDILVLDEPANGLDPQGIAWLRDFLKWYVSEDVDNGDGRIVIVSSHLLSEAQLTVDDVIVMAGGRLAAQGKLADLLSGTKRSVRVKTPDTDRLVEALHAAHLPAAVDGGYVVSDGTQPEVVGPILVENRIEVHEMTSSTESLESLFFELTGGEGMHPGHGADLMGDYRRSAGQAPPVSSPAPAGPDERSRPPDAMSRLLRAEVRKLWTIWSTYVLFVILVVLDLGFGFAIAYAPGGRRGGAAGIVPHGSSQWFVNVFSVLDNSRLLALVLGALIITGEYRHKTVTPTFLAEPRRGRVVVAKLGTAFGGGLGLGVMTMVMGLVVGLVLVAVKVHSCLTQLSFQGVQQGMSEAACRAQHGIYFVAGLHTLWQDWSRIAPGVILGTGLFAVYGLGLGALLKNQVVAIVVGLGFTLVVETIVGAIWPSIGEYLPGQAATALEDAARTSFAVNSRLLPWWGGAVILVIYGVVLALLGTFTTLRSDVT